MTFADEIRPLIEAAGGTKPAAAALQVTQQCLNRWLRGKEPNLVTRTGVLALLRAGKSFSEPPLTPINAAHLRTLFSRPERAPLFGGLLKAKPRSG